MLKTHEIPIQTDSFFMARKGTGERSLSERPTPLAAPEWAEWELAGRWCWGGSYGVPQVSMGFNIFQYFSIYFNKLKYTVGCFNTKII